MLVCSRRWLWYGLLAFALCAKASHAKQAPAPPALPDKCTLSKWPNKNPITSIAPMSINDGSVTSLQVTGNSLSPSWTIVLCPKSAVSQAVDQPKPDPSRGSTTSSLWALVTANSGTAGDYALYIADDAKGAVYDSGQTLTIGTPDDARFVACSGPGGRGKPTPDLACSFNPLSYQTAYDAFGKGVANRFIAVQVIVRNKNANFEYLLQDMRMGKPGFVVSTYDKSIPQAISVKAEQFSARAITLRTTAATASILTGVAGFTGGAILQDTANIFAGPFQASLQAFIPNLSTAELATLDNLAFSVKSTVIPKSGAIMVIGFIPSDTVKPSDNAKTKAIAKPFKWMTPTPNNFSGYRGTDLENLFKEMTVSVAGTHVQAVNPSQPTLTQFIPPGSNTNILLSKFQQSPPFYIEGTGLDSVTQVQLSNRTDNKTVISATLKSMGSATSIDPNADQLIIPTSATATTGKYEISFILASGSAAVDTNQNISVVGLSITSSAGKPVIVTITGSGFGTSGVVAFTGSGQVPAASITNWTDSTIVVNVPSTGVQTGPVTVTTADGTLINAGTYTIP